MSMSMSMSLMSMSTKIPNVSVTSGSEPRSDEENKNMSVKQESRQFLDPSLSNMEVDCRSKLELNLLDFLRGKSTNAPESSRNARKVEKQRTYYCKYCNRKYFNLQALGGHQNAHKRERALEKRGNTVNDAAAAIEHTKSMLHPYSGMTEGPMQGSFNKTLGILMPSLISNPYNHWLHGGVGHANQGWPRPDIMRPQAQMHQPQNGGSQPVANMITNSNHHESNTSLSNQQGETLGLDLSLKL